MSDIELEPIEDLDNNPPKFKGIKYPIPNHRGVQPPYYCFCAFWTRGSGKSFVIVKHLLNQEKYGFKSAYTGEDVKLRHILFSPTAHNNPIFRTLKYLDEDDIYEAFDKEKFEEILMEIKKDKDYTKYYNEYREIYK